MVIAAFRNWNRQLRPTGDAPGVGRARLRRGIEVALAIVLLVQIARLVWLFLAPSPIISANAAPATVAAPDYSIFQRFDAFFRTGAPGALTEATAQGSSQMRLYGVRADGTGGGSAIIGLADGRQVSVGVGDEIEPGLILRSVANDHVVMARGESLSRLMFTELPMGAAAPPPPPSEPQVVTPQGAAPAEAGQAAAATPAGPSVDPARLMAQAGLRPRMQGLGINGFTVSGTGDGSALAAAGLRSGDVILAVNGQALDSPARIAGLRGQLSNSTSAEIRFERNGVEQTTTIRTGR
ncbi:MAG: PDZ domain-containing protein [Brevundimonas sp.]|uniref:type II secretion system protein N n=1 Tax=Brevundimonas sp. TaxID=1871086 RepID=UPI001A2787C7|nr:type II secretion system protein N [Brevundimonas sp.]MBJ7446140.1 PDZ domain-containing protein [Brevundimonas sp.]